MENSLQDPRNMLKAVSRSTKLVGMISTSFGVVMAVAYGIFNRIERYRPLFELIGVVLFFIPGILFMIAGTAMVRRQTWSVPMAMMMAVGQTVLALGTFIAQFFLSPITPIPVVLNAVWIAAWLQLIFHLYRVRSALRTVESEEWLGFQVTPLPSPQEVPLAKPLVLQPAHQPQSHPIEAAADQ